jgi:tRNA threonylcarbamoyladenosine biosynthesis protein TsaB
LEKPVSIILAIESSTSQCSVALKTGTGTFEKKADAIGTHSSAIFTQIQDILLESGFTLDDIQAVIVGRGPGSYTGLRVAVSAIKGLIFGRNILFYSANTLASFAASLPVGKEFITIHSVIDARRKHLYWQKFEVNIDQILPVNDHCIIEIESIYEEISPGDVIVGTGLQRLDASRMEKVTLFPIEHTGASALIRLMDIADVSIIKPENIQEFEPVYVTSEA